MSEGKDNRKNDRQNSKTQFDALISQSNGKSRFNYFAGATIMKPVLTLIIAAMALDLQAQPGPVPGLYNTGVDDNNNLLPLGSVDGHYTLIGSADTNYPGPDAVVPIDFPGPSDWMTNGPNSEWISPSLTTADSPYNTPGVYVYRTTFDLSQFDISTVTVTGSWASDDDGDDIYLNGVATGNPHLNSVVTAALDWKDFTITNGFLPATNTLDFVVSNWPAGGPGGTGGSPTGLRVELSATGVPLFMPCPTCPGPSPCYLLETQCINGNCKPPSILLALTVILLPVYIYEKNQYEDCMKNCEQRFLRCITGAIVPSPQYTLVQTNIVFATAVVQQTAAGHGLRFTLDTNGVAMPFNLTVGAWDGSNVLASTTATNVEFFVTELTNLAAYLSSSNLAQLPWMDLGSASFDASHHFWHRSWTPAKIESYVVQTRVYDPTLTNLFLDNAGVMTNGYASLFDVISPGSMVPMLTSPGVAANGDAQLHLLGPAAFSFTLQASPDLTSWRSLFTATNFSGSSQITDASGSSNRMFYRAVLQGLQ